MHERRDPREAEEFQDTVTLHNLTVLPVASIPEFQFIVNEDNVADPFDPYPLNWPSLTGGASHSPVVATGDSSRQTVSLPAGRYLVSVRAPGYKLGGAWVDLQAATTVQVQLVPHPLPLSKIRVHVFEDNCPVNGEDDVPLESGLSGFRIIVTDALGEVTVDYYGNPLGTEYQRDLAGNPLYGPDGQPVPVEGTGGIIRTDASGDAVVENLPPGKYGVQAIPPDGSDWVQTTTIEGTHVIDAWVEEGNDGYSPREGFQMPLVWIGFVRPMKFLPGEGSGTISGRIRTVIEFTPPFRPLTLGDPVDRPWIALSDIGTNDQQVYTGRGNPDGTFSITGVPAGVYQMAIWDEPLDHIIAFRTVQVADGEAVDMGDIGIPRWYGWISGMVFHDENGNGVRDAGEEGVPNVAVGTRFKDGSVQYSSVTGMDGRYSIDEVFELERFTVAELDYTRFGPTVATATPDAGIDPARPTTTHPGALTLAALTWAAKTNRIDWGIREYPHPGPDAIPGTEDDTIHGGISGTVCYATMRNELDPRRAVAEDYEPGIPGVTVNLYRAEPDGSRTLINSTTTDAWQHPEGCLRPDGTTDPLCLEVPGSSNQVRDGVYDGGYAFTTWFDPYLGAPGAVEKPLEPGTYLVQVVPPADPYNPEGGRPRPLYKVLAPDSVNTGEGDAFHALIAPPPYVGEGYDTKKVTLHPGQNAAADFFLYTDVPAPGRIVGFLLDDVNLETDPAFIYYGEKRGVPHTPVGIRDFTGRLIKTVHSDANGVFEVLLPSTYTTNVPTPSGVAPGMYLVVGNDPGDPENPNLNYNPNYQTLTRTFDVWPGKTTYADMAIFPITAFVGTPGARFSQPPVCSAAGTPRIGEVNRVYVTPFGNRTIILYGDNFGPARGRVYLRGLSIPVRAWTDTAIAVEVPSTFTPGPGQLTVETSAGAESTQGITIHVIGPWYNPPVYHATPETTLQAAIDSAPHGSLIIAGPGTYYENPIIYRNVKVQGMGPDATVIDGRFFSSYQATWSDRLNSLPFDGPREIPSGQVITFVAEHWSYGPYFRTQIDGCTITGARGEKGGGIFANTYCRFVEISNNVIRSNGGGFGGGITIGLPYRGSNANEGLWIHNNRILNNGGVSLAGGVGIYSGAHGYQFDHNEVCGNYSAEYGGGLSHYGLSQGGLIHHNKFLFNSSFDEGGGIFVGGEQPVPPESYTSGSGIVAIYNNLIQGNVANDDGGGIRLLQPGNHRIDIFNNLIVNNVSTDLGGGLALDDAPDVVIFNNTVAKNLSTATAEDSDGLPHGAGLVSEAHSAGLMALLPPGSPNFSNPVLFNNIFCDNRAGWYDQGMNGGRGGIAGIGDPNDTNPVRIIDLEVFGTPVPEHLTPRYCSLTVPYGNADPTNLIGDPLLVAPYDTRVSAISFNMEPDFKAVKIVSVYPELQGDYHLSFSSPLIDRGTASLTDAGEVYYAPVTDYDDRPRPLGPAVDIGATETR